MARLALFTSWCLVLLPSILLASPLAPCLNGICGFSRRDLPISQIVAELGPLLSAPSSIFGADDSRWTNATIRFQGLVRPDIQLVIQPGQESDVATIVSPDICLLGSM